MVSIFNYGLLTPLAGWWLYLIFISLTFILLVFASRYYSLSGVFTMDKRLDVKEITFLRSAFITYFIWGVIQQICVLTIFNILYVTIHLPLYLVILITVYSFSMFLHYPNLLLMFAVGFMEMVLLIIFIKFPNIYLMALTHSILATTLSMYFPGYMTRDFRVLKSFMDFFKRLRD